MTARHSASRRKTLSPLVGTDSVPKSYADTLPSIYTDTDGVPYIGTVGTPQTSMAGREIAYAQTRVRTSAANGWVDVDGLEFVTSTASGPARITLNLGLVVMGPISTTVARTFEYRILDATNQSPIAYATMSLPSTTEGGFTSQGTSPLTSRLSAGLPDIRYIAQIKAGQDNTPVYVVPEWLPNAIGELAMVGI